MPQRKFGDGRKRSGDPIAVEEVLDPQNLQRLWTLVGVGCLVSVSRSRDGGALAVTVFSDGKSEREWFRNRQEAADWLDDILGLIDTPA